MVYKVYDVQKNVFVASYDTKQQAIDHADSLCSIEQFSGVVEVHELDEADTQLLNPRRVYTCQG